MRKSSFLTPAVILTAVLAACSTSGDMTRFRVPVEYHKLDNGLKVVLSQDDTSPLAIVAVYYNIGFRIEPKNRTGFAHLFEHMMFQGSENLEKMEFVRLVQSNGGLLNGSTRFDFTNYFEVVPSNKLETVLWAEADRMRGLSITQENLTNQQGVVTNEVKVNVLNQPYGGFPWLDMPQYANENWYNSHNFYGDLEDLQAATIEDVQNFFDTYYAPNNAALVVVGDFDPTETLFMIKKYFGDIPPAQVPELPDLSEPRQEETKRFTKQDPLATRPAVAFSYHVPERNTPEYYAMGVLDQLLLQGNDSMLYQELVQKHGLTGSVDGGINIIGNMFNYNGPMLWTGYLFFDNDVDPDTILTVVEAAIKKVRLEPIPQELLDLALVKMRSDFYETIDNYYGVGRADLLASFALFDNDPSRINSIEEKFREITPELLQRTAREYLRPTARTALIIEPTAS